MMPIDETFWPASLAHLASPYMDKPSQYVSIGEISSEPVGAYSGTRLLYTAMVPLTDADECLERIGGIGQGVSNGGPDLASTPSGVSPASPFWVESRRPDAKRYQSLVETWRVHDRHVLLPYGGFLQHYGLVPRVIQDGTIAWDDLSVPTFDVVRVTPVSIYTIGGGHSTARVDILREYLEDFLFANESVAIATQFEQRHSSSDPAFDDALGGKEGLNVKLKGRELWLKRVEHFEEGDQLSDVWCTRLVMKPERAMESDETLEWPDHDGPIVGSGIVTGFSPMEEAFVRDEVLLDYENRPEFEIHPESGMVGHGGWWSVGYCRRVGRDHIGLELRKLYDGAQFAVVKHYCAFAVKKSSIPDMKDGEAVRNIGIRARDVVQSYLELVRTIQAICDAAGMSFTENEIGSFSSAEIRYRGWWTFDALGRLGNVSADDMPYSQFLARCKDLYRLLEGLKTGPLRTLMRTLGVSKSEADQHEGLKLSAFLCQFASIAQGERWNLISDSSLIAARWDKNTRLDCYRPLFALYGLRQADAHVSSSSAPGNQASNLQVFGIDSDKFKAGWGRALDRVYDSIAGALRDASKLLLSVPATK